MSIPIIAPDASCLSVCTGANIILCSLNILISPKQTLHLILQLAKNLLDSSDCLIHLLSHMIDAILHKPVRNNTIQKIIRKSYNARWPASIAS